MFSSIYFRIVGQGTALAMHAGNSLVMFLSMQDEELMQDPKIKDMTSMQSRYLTVWNIAFQMAYFSLAFTCDFLTVIGKDNLISKSMRQIRQTLFSTIVLPVTAIIFTVFWPIFIYDRELLFPEFIDKIFSFKSNLVMHFFILPAALWELAFLPRPKPKSHRLNVGIMVILYIVYNSFVIHTFHQRGLFPYPIFMMTYGTIYFPIFLLIALFVGLMVYFLQWNFNVTEKRREKNRKSGKVKFS